MPSNALVPFFTDNETITATAQGAITGKRFVKFVVGGRGGLPTVATADATTRANAVACYDQADGQTLPIQLRNCVPVTAGEDLLAGDRIKSDAQGRAVKIAAATEGDEDNPATPGEDHLAIGVVYVNTPAGSDAPINLTF